MFLRRMSQSFPFPVLRNEIDRTVGDLFDTVTSFGPLSGIGRREFPALNVWEDEGNLFAECEVPGLTMENVEVLVQNNELTIRGERKVPTEENVTFHRQERGAGQFARTIRLPIDVDAEHVSATLRDGVLSIVLPKSQTAMPRKIKVTG